MTARQSPENTTGPFRFDAGTSGVWNAVLDLDHTESFPRIVGTIPPSARVAPRISVVVAVASSLVALVALGLVGASTESVWAVAALALLALLGAVLVYQAARISLAGIEDLSSSLREPGVAKGVSIECLPLSFAAKQLRDVLDDALEREKALRVDAEHADRERSRFLTSVSHELRTPLNAILGFTDVLLQEIDGPLTESQREDLEHIRNSGAHLSALFRDVIDLAAAASAQLRIEREWVAPNEILEDVANELRGARGERSVRIVIDSPADMPKAYVDPIRLRQIVGNLAHNALKFTARGAVTLGTEPTIGGHIIWVRDTGAGISEEDRSAIFGDFEQTLGTAQSDGFGLGLAIARTLVELHGGRISLESELGVGSTFTVWLPAPKQSRRPRAMESS